MIHDLISNLRGIFPLFYDRFLRQIVVPLITLVCCLYCIVKVLAMVFQMESIVTFIVFFNVSFLSFSAIYDFAKLLPSQLKFLRYDH